MSSKIVVLSVIDQTIVRAYIRNLLFFPFPHLDQAPIAAARLKKALVTTISCWPYLAGTVGPADEDNGKILLEYNDEIPDVETSGLFCAKILDDFLWTYSELKEAGVPPSRVPGDIFVPDALRERDGIDSPIAEGRQSLASVPIPVLAVQANFIQGGLVLSIYCHHSVVDGAGLTIFFEKFATNMRTESSLGSQADWHTDPTDPSASRQALSNLAIPINHQNPPTCPEISRGLAWKFPRSANRTRPPCTGRLFTIAHKRLRLLREELSNTSKDLTIFDVLAALIWTFVNRARASHLPEEGNTTIGIVVNTRHKLDPPLPPDYLGNAALYSMATLPLCHFVAEDIVTAKTLAPAAQAIRRAVSVVDDTWVRTRLAFFASLEDVRGLRPNINFSFGSDIMLTSWREFGADLDWSIPGTASRQPEFIRKPFSAEDGGNIIMPRRRLIRDGEEEAPYEVLMQLAKLDMDALMAEEGGLMSWAIRSVE
ncbi:hypothetical protein AOQ84DRAFT_412899 [Glonium stellatum]|uniref:Uncharacterized protein n=1 Tax=Glonium stellatum TaxID=574774 RepID=A0A8E2FB17_9PEZI|nr:hypothetical protein AOQ84DRAFT_412899 [Glonium stellatum]